MQELLLDGVWTMTDEDKMSLSGKIPGSVCSFLLDAGKIEDPYYRENELETLPLFEKDYVFYREFDCPEEMRSGKNKQLVFEGIDTLSDVYLNKHFLGHTDNFHRVWSFDVTEILEEKDNLLEVKIQSPTRFIREKDSQYHVGGTKHAMKGFPQLRKPHCMFGWDWGPRIPDEGIWNHVRLISFDDARLTDIRIHQEHSDDVSVTVSVQYEGNVDVKIRMETPDHRVFSLENGVPFVVDNPMLWWPNGLGEQPLYTVTVDLEQNGVVIETQKKRIGLRTLTIRRRKDKWGESFAHEVNGKAFFAMGADYIPEDNLISRVTKERTRKLLEDCKESHFNVIRVWGGGYFPKEDFYDACDELGLVIWQDMMFACANYKLDDEFEENITAEIWDNVTRIRHHACLGLWCGNNEMEQLSLKRNYEGNEIFQAYYIRLFEHVIPHILKKANPDTYYWPSSPSSGGSYVDPNSPDFGDVHNWDVWHAGVPFADYRRHHFRYLSEFGFQALPDYKTILSFTEEEDRNMFSRVMERHQRNEGANGKMLQYLSMTYLYPNSFELLVYATQLLQADAIRYGVEHFRRNRNDDLCMGAVYWQLNDIWPVASWASIDYYGRWKALQYYAKRFFAPVMISCEETCELTARSSIVAEPTPNVSTARLCVTNETLHEKSGTVIWELRAPDSSILAQGSEKLSIPALSSVWLELLDFSDTDYRSNHLSYRFEADGEIVSSGSVLFTAPKHYRFMDPKLSVTRQGDFLIVSSQAYAKGVEIYTQDEDIRLEDNFFDMEAGERKIRVLEGNTDNFKVRSVFDIK